MTKRPIVGVPTQTLQSLGGVSAEIPASWVMSQRYILTLVQAGAIPWMIPLVDESTLRGVFDALDGVFLPGGADIDPASYGKDPHALCDRTDPERDRVELSLARWALEEGTPMLGVCRGMQLINIAAGGSLYQDLAEQMPGSIKHDYFPYRDAGYSRDHLAHEVDILPGTLLAQVFAAGRMRVNSMHHQGVRDLAPSLRASAVAEDGLIEGLEVPGREFILGVQWHPEALTDGDASMRALFQHFVAAAAGERSSTVITGDWAGLPSLPPAPEPA